jgi:hypothetical protein
MNFQAAVTAIAGVNLLLGTPLGWLDGLVDDTPTAVGAESGGPGDDIRVELKNNEVAEVQVKKGLSRSEDLWAALLALATGLDAGTIHYGVLVVSPDSSKSVWNTLAQDLQRLGEGRSDGLSEIGQTWQAKLSAAALPVAAVCARLRLYVVHALDMDAASIQLAKARLAGLCAVATDVDRVWSRLYADGHAIAARRGRWDATGLARTLAALGVHTIASATPGSVTTRVCRWAFDVNQVFSVVGVKTPLSIADAWLPLKARVIDATQEKPADLAAAMAHYHASSHTRRTGNREQTTLDAEWIGRFIPRALVMAGPGMGKSTLMTKLAQRYAGDGFPVLKVRLPVVAARLESGHGFQESVLQLGLDGSGVSATDAANSGLTDWVLLCDGLDECGPRQERVSEAIRQFVIGHPRARVIVTTRPIGYHTAQLSDWRHYELLAPETSAGAANLASVLRAASPARSDEPAEWAFTLASEQLQGNAAQEVVSRSPQLLGMAASLLARGGALGASKVELYQRLFDIIDAEPSSRTGSAHQPNAAVLTRVLNVVGWELISEPLATYAIVISRCTERLRLDLDAPALQAKATVNAALEYWQQVGLIEKVHYGTTDMLTFIHKTFAEFAAARFLWDAKDPTERSTWLTACLEDHERWSEVLAFASSQLGDEILQALLARHARDDRRAIDRALRLLVDTPTGISEDTAESVLRFSFLNVDAANTIMALRTGALLAQLAPRFPGAIGALARARLDASPPWTQRVAWACVVETGVFDLDVAHAKLLEFFADAKPVYGGLFGGLKFRSDPEDDLHERIALAVVKQAVSQWPVDRIANLLRAFSGQGFETVGFQIRLADIVKAAGVTVPLRPGTKNKDAIAALMPSDDYRNAHATAMAALLDAVASLEPALGNGAPPETPVQLSALFDVIGLNESPASDVWAWTEPFDQESLREVLRGLIALSVIETGQLQREAAAARSRLDEVRRDPTAWFVPDSVDVDVPALDWTRARLLGLDRRKLEQAALHKSEWLAVAATNLLECLEPLGLDELAALLAKANGLGLLTIGYLARKQGATGTKLLLDRLAGPVVTGFQHLLVTLGKTQATWAQLAAGVGKALLVRNARIAQAAADLAMKHLQAGAAVPDSLLEEAYQFWEVNEEPYPKTSGVVPDSPRKTLLSALDRIRPIADERAIGLLNDARSDIKDFSFALLSKRATESEATRTRVVAAITAKQLIAASTARLLGSAMVFSADEILALSGLFSDADPAYRLAALQLVSAHRLPNALLLERVQHLTTDAHGEVRRSARTLIDKLEIDGIPD